MFSSRNICEELLKLMKPDSMKHSNKNGTTKVLNAPVHLGTMAANLESTVDDLKSIWVISRDDSLVRTFMFLISTNSCSFR